MSKKILLFGLAIVAGLQTADAQQSLRLKTTNLRAASLPALNGDVYTELNQTGGSTPKAKPKNNKISAWPGSVQIGKSYYDLQSNSSTGNRLLRHPDGTLTAVWTEHCGPGNPNFNDRGAGYNYYNGTTWIEGTDGTCNEAGAAFGVSSLRTGWPEIMRLGGTREAIISHSSGDGLTFDTHPAKGVQGLGSWAPTALIPHTKNISGTGNNATWPRAVSKGDTIHLVYAVNNSSGTATNPLPILNGVANPMLYSRSFDGGQTWNKQNVFLPGMRGVDGSDVSTQTSESFNRIGGDDYAIAVKGSTVAIVTGSMGEPWTLWKSTDNGDTFTRRVIKAIGTQDAIPLNNTNNDTAAITNDGNHAILIDNNNNVHVWAGIILAKVITKTQTGAPGNTYFRANHSWFPHAASTLWYWNDTRPMGAAPDSIADVDEVLYPGANFPEIALDPNKRSPYGATGIISMPNAALAANGDIYMVYSSVVRGYSNTVTATGQPFRDLYIMKRRATDGLWSHPLNLPVALNVFGGTSGAENFEESVFPTVPRTIGADNILHLMWMSDSEPGMVLGADLDPESENQMLYYPVNVNSMTFVFPIIGGRNEISTYVNHISAYPNPASGKVNLAIDLKKASDVKVRVTNIMGQEVAGFTQSNLAAGQNIVSLDMSGYAKGVYLYTISSDNFSVTNRVVKH